ncbi:MAG: NADPH-dependent 7-cyano-7-deazaguanine reductase QueF [Kangiellaceae bacterium]|jgi:7-cyano-7-deazaguanine reductase|nr:NADPH-dependent 7-cyano-7-deazaguanine reductase QueF [Kangiellaceae bacterium]
MSKTIPLGEITDYPSHYDANLLFPVTRADKRNELAIGSKLPFSGFDLWTAYELSWLNENGKPQVAIAEFLFAIDNPNIIESKSFKLYLNSFNQERVSRAEMQRRLEADLSRVAGGRVTVIIYSLDEYQTRGFKPPEGLCIDDADIADFSFEYQPSLLKLEPAAKVVNDQILYSHLLKSNCLITSQPDWATIFIQYSGAQISQESLLRYLVSFRQHDEFHEQCVERIYQDIIHHCQPEQLSVYARYTRRGGLDINPYRSSKADDPWIAGKMPVHARLARQ